jgi:uncharacterized protein (TIGR03435 family)
MRLMMQSPLAERFKLAVHFETNDGPVLALTLVKPGQTGPKLRAHAEGPPCGMPLDAFPPICGTDQLNQNAKGLRRIGYRNGTMATMPARPACRGGTIENPVSVDRPSQIPSLTRPFSIEKGPLPNVIWYKREAAPRN